jgi:hypothetical protein
MVNSDPAGRWSIIHNTPGGEQQKQWLKRVHITGGKSGRADISGINGYIAICERTMPN